MNGYLGNEVTEGISFKKKHLLPYTSNTSSNRSPQELTGLHVRTLKINEEPLAVFSCWEIKGQFTYRKWPLINLQCFSGKPHLPRYLGSKNWP